ncbi:RDD family protein [Kingella oralis]|uniref:RDD family protein n=1 Tax=Kingella oralis TaxID=505 RepID=UPI0034E49ED8
MRPIAPLKRRFAALLYESLLIGSVTILAGIVAGIVNTAISRNAPALAAAIPLLTSLVFLAAWWQYFRLNWQREGQTLPMRVWQIGLTDLAGSRPGKKQLLLRFAWACVLLVFLPLLAYAALQQLGWHGRNAAVAALFWWILPWGFALFNPRKQFLYDWLAGTELIDLRQEDSQSKP